MIIKNQMSVEMIMIAQNKFSDCILVKLKIKKTISNAINKLIICCPLNTIGFTDINP